VILTLTEKVIRRRLSANVEADDAVAGDAEAKL